MKQLLVDLYSDTRGGIVNYFKYFHKKEAPRYNIPRLPQLYEKLYFDESVVLFPFDENLSLTRLLNQRKLTTSNLG